MKPKSLSATSLGTAQECLARWKAESMDRTERSGNNTAANIGSAVHNALEAYVEYVYIDKKGPPDFDMLRMLLHVKYKEVFDTADTSGPEFEDCLHLIDVWFKRTSEYLDEVEVLSVEVKRSMMIPTTQGPIPFNYIWDRADALTLPDGRRILKVVDYKTIRANLAPGELYRKIQAQCYSVAARMEMRERGLVFDEIWIEFDLLRHEPILAKFTLQDDQANWQWIKDMAEKILAWPIDTAPPEKLGSGCRWCVRKTQCVTLASNIAGGGVLGLTVDELAQKRYELDNQQAAIKYALEEIDQHLLAAVEKSGEFEIEAGGYEVRATARATRKVDGKGLAEVLGPELMARYGNMTLTILDKILKTDELTDQQKQMAKALIRKEYGEPSVKLTTLMPHKP